MSRLRAELSQAHKVNALLKKQLEMDNESSGFNPNLLVQMAQEIEDLKHRLGKRMLATKTCRVMYKTE